MLTDRELAALQTSLYLLEGQFAYAEPLRLALQNLALGRPNPQGASERGRVTLTLAGGGYSPEIAQRLAKLENAISKQKTIVFSLLRDEPPRARPRGRSTRTACTSPSRQWYLVGRDHDRDDMRVFRVSRIRGDIRFATRRERDFRIPEDFDPATYRDRAAWQLGERGRRGRRCTSPRARPGWSSALWGARGTIETATPIARRASPRRTPTSSCWCSGSSA